MVPVLYDTKCDLTVASAAAAPPPMEMLIADAVEMFN